MEINYNETNAAIFAHENISSPMQQKYSIDQLGYLLDLVYEYYESIDTDEENDTDINIVEMTSFINSNISKNFCKPITHKELEELLLADNAYMESIGLLEPETEDEAEDLDDDDDVVNIDAVVDEIYVLLPEDLKSKYKTDDVYAVLCIECDYLNECETEEVDEAEMYKYIQENAAEEDIKISIEEIKTILAIEAKFLGEE
jgi:hypothetical protein